MLEIFESVHDVNLLLFSNGLAEFLWLEGLEVVEEIFITAF